MEGFFSRTTFLSRNHPWTIQAAGMKLCVAGSSRLIHSDANTAGTLPRHPWVTLTSSVRPRAPCSFCGSCPCPLLQMLPSCQESWSFGGQYSLVWDCGSSGVLPGEGGADLTPEVSWDQAEAGTSPEDRPWPGLSPSLWAPPPPPPLLHPPPGNISLRNPLPRGPCLRACSGGMCPKSWACGLDVI